VALDIVQFLSLEMATACADEITLPRSGRVGRLNGRGGSLPNAEAVVEYAQEDPLRA
jgi:hypothetical protein